MYNFRVYHHDDTDGCMSAHIIRKYIENNFSNNLTPRDFQEKNYDAPFDFERVNRGDLSEGRSGTICFVVDLSFTKKTYPQLLELCDKATMVVWIDHHQSSKDLIDSIPVNEFPNNLIAIVNTSLSATLLCYGVSMISPFSLMELKGIHPNINRLIYVYDPINLDTSSPSADIIVRLYNGLILYWATNDIFNGQTGFLYSKELTSKVPIGLMLVDDHDRWQNKVLNSDEFFLGIYSEEATFLSSNIDKDGMPVYNLLYTDILNSKFIGEKIKDGCVIKKYLFSRYERELKSKFNIIFKIGEKYYNVCCMNSRGNSWVFQDDYNTYDAVMLFSYSGSSKKWIHSIYSSNPDFDCSKIAEHYGGGGHKGAAGFSLDEPIFVVKDNSSVVNFIIE